MLGITVTRTANAGVLLEIDGKSILLDGVCEPLPPYLGTPLEIRHSLTRKMPDALAFTHEHPDHYDASYTELYKEKTLRLVYGPESLPFYELGAGLCISLCKTRHLGKTDIPHVSYVIKGSRTVYFMGDASISSLREMTEQPKPDLLIAPFSYAITPSAWRMTKELGAQKILILHLPSRDDDRDGLWSMLENTVQADDTLFSLNIGEKISL